MNSGVVVWAMMLTALVLTLPMTTVGVTLVILMLLGWVSTFSGVVGLVLVVVGGTGFYLLYRWFTEGV